MGVNGIQRRLENWNGFLPRVTRSHACLLVKGAKLASVLPDKEELKLLVIEACRGDSGVWLW